MKILIPQLQKELEASAGANLLTVLVAAKLPLAHSCAGEGVCATCVVKIEGGDLPPLTERETRLIKKLGRKFHANQRFACLVKVPESSKTWVLSTEYW